MNAPSFAGRLALQQRVLPVYRKPFFELLAQACQAGLFVLAGQPLAVEGIACIEQLEQADLHRTRNYHFRDPQSSLYLCWQAGLLNWLQACEPQALIVEANPRYLSSYLAVAWMRRRGRPVLGWGLGAPRAGQPLERHLRLAFLRSLDGVIAYSRRGVAEYQSLGLTNVFWAPNAVAPRPDWPLPVRPPGFGERPQLLFVGRLQARKRLESLFQACANLQDARQPRLVIVGDGPARADFERQAAQIYPATEFVGARHGADLDPYFRQADLFVLPGTGGLAVQQAMSFGLPVIVAQGDGTQDDLVRPQNGWQVPAGDQAALTTALHAALADVVGLRQMGAESYRIVSQEVNLQSMIAGFVQALNQVRPGAASTKDG